MDGTGRMGRIGTEGWDHEHQVTHRSVLEKGEGEGSKT